jgi:hypothetical protein
MTTTQISVANGKARQLAKRPQLLAIYLLLFGVCSLCAQAQDAHQHTGCRGRSMTARRERRPPALLPALSPGTVT